MSEVALAGGCAPASASVAVRVVPADGLGQTVTGEIPKGANVDAQQGSKVVIGEPLSASESGADGRTSKPGPARQPRRFKAEPDIGTAAALIGPRWIPWLFAAKTTASGLLALLVAFTFNLDQPRWSLITVFIVAQPQSGLVLAKSFYRIIGTLVGAAGALLLVSLFAQERVLFLGTLAIWIGLCTFASKYARNFASYGFVLSGYTVAIVGIPGALEPGNAFFIAEARVTEISLGIIATAAISHLILPVSLADALRRAVATGRAELADYAAALLGGLDTTSLRAKLLGQVIAIEHLRASAIFEDRAIRDRSGALRQLDIALLGVVDIAYLLGRSLDWLRRGGAVIGPGLDGAVTRAAAAVDLWRSGRLDAAGLSRRFVRASARLPLARQLYWDPLVSDGEVIRAAAVIGRLREFFAAFVAFAEAYEAFLSREPQPVRAPRFAVSNDRASAVWAGLRAALALLLVSLFWIFADWPSGEIAAILAAVATARVATMEPAVPIAIGATLAIVLAIVPSFILIEVLLPHASGFPMFALAVAPMVFCCAYLMAHEKTAIFGFVGGLYFAYAASFQDRMAYDPVGFLNISIAAALAIATCGLLYAIVAPETPQAACRRFVRAARKAFERIARRPGIRLPEFETSITDALDQLRHGLRPDRGEDAAAVEAAIALLGAGRELIRVRDGGRPTPAGMEVEAVRFLATKQRLPLDRARRAAQDASVTCLAELRDDRLGVADARAAEREMVAFAAIGDELERGGELVLDGTSKGVQRHVA
jgi:uncharacterized membrane protein YccC